MSRPSDTLADTAVDVGSRSGESADTAPQPSTRAAASIPDAVPVTPAIRASGRSLAVSGIASLAAAMAIAGIFGSWSARAVAALGVGIGTGWVWLTLRAKRRTVVVQALLPVAATFVGLLLILTTQGPSRGLGRLVADAVSEGRLLRPPVPFAPGWRLVLVLMLAVIAFGNGWVATALNRPRLALLMPVPITFLAAISQPKESELASGLVFFALLLAATAILFSGNRGDLAVLTRRYERKRAVRGVAAGGLVVVLLVIASRASFLFPAPAFDPANKPQKPRPVPLSAARDRVLFEVDPGSSGIKGPWRLGVLDVFDGRAWRLPPFSADRLRPVPRGGAVTAGAGGAAVSFVIRDLGKGAVLPGLSTPRQIEAEGINLLIDPRTEIFRVKTGSVPPGFAYTMSTVAYPGESALDSARIPDVGFEEQLEVPSPPEAVQALLSAAPPSPWSRLKILRDELYEVAVAAGPGLPTDVPPQKVQDLLAGSHEGTPFEIVAAEALLARWAGVPSRIGFGFDLFNEEKGKLTVRPRNGANWLEVYFEELGWLPLVGTPPKAKESLDPDNNTRFDPTVAPGDEVGLELFIPIEVTSLRRLYERIRAAAAMAIAAGLGAWLVYASWPALLKLRRARKRRTWAVGQGLRAQVAVEYIEFRDLTTDLGLGEPRDTPLEYTKRLVDDAEHDEFAWLVTRSLYGDLASTVDEHDVEAAGEMARSLRRRLLEAQPFHNRVLALIARSSLRQPYTLEAPIVRQVSLRRAIAGGAGALRHRAGTVGRGAAGSLRRGVERVGGRR